MTLGDNDASKSCCALGGVVGGVIGKAGEGVMFRTSVGLEVTLTATKVNDNAALGGMVGGVICMHDGILYLSFLL